MTEPISKPTQHSTLALRSPQSAIHHLHLFALNGSRFHSPSPLLCPSSSKPSPVRLSNPQLHQNGFYQGHCRHPCCQILFSILFHNQLELLLRSIDTDDDSNLPETISSFDFQYIIIFYFKFCICCSYTLISFTTSSLSP